MKTALCIIIIIILFISCWAWASEIDLSKSEFKWTASKLTGKHYGRIFIKEASFQMPDDKVISGKIIMDMTSFTVDDLKGKWRDKFIDHMKSSDFFEVEKFPTAMLLIKKIDEGKLVGVLTIKGVSHPVSFPVIKKGNKYSGKMTFDRTKFGITYGSGSFFQGLGDKLIKDEVHLDFTVIFK